MIRWGILGAARIADRALVPAIRAAGQEVAVVGSRSKERAEAFAGKHGIARSVGSYEEVVTDDQVDAVYVALPNDLHEPWATAALSAGRHVLCEKPLATDAAGARRLSAASSVSGKLLMEALMSRFHPRTAALVELVRGGEIGELRSMSASFAFPMHAEDDIRNLPEHGGGALLDVGVYGVSLSRWVAGEEPETVRALAGRRPSGVDGWTSALLGFPSGAVANVHASFESSPYQLAEVVGTTTSVLVPEPFTAGTGRDALLLVDGRSPVGPWRVDPYEAMVRAFATAAESGAREAPLPTTDAVATATVLDRIASATRPLPR